MQIPFFSKKREKKPIKFGKEHKVIVYSTQTCPWCAKTKEFLHENNIPFKNRDVGISRKYAKEMVKKSGQMGVPVVDIDGEIVIGFNEDKMRSLLNL